MTKFHLILKAFFKIYKLATQAINQMTMHIEIEFSMQNKSFSRMPTPKIANLQILSNQKLNFLELLAHLPLIRINSRVKMFKVLLLHP